jgi:DNA-directed RNA polymerase subunit K/omega
MFVIIVDSLGVKIKNDDLYKEILLSKLIMATSCNSVLTYTKQPFDECNKILNSLDKPKVSKMIMTKYEFNQIISLRTCQLSLGAIPFVDIVADIKSNMDLRKIALEELKQNKIPFLIKRPLPNNKYEFVKVRDLNLTAVKYMFDL